MEKETFNISELNESYIIEKKEEKNIENFFIDKIEMEKISYDDIFGSESIDFTYINNLLENKKLTN